MTSTDTADLRALVERYAATVDARTFAELDHVFTTDAVLETGRGRRDGLAAIQTAMDGLHRYDRTEHRVLGSEIAVEDDSATGTVTGTAHHWFVDDGRHCDHQMEITYHDRYVRTAGGWRIEHRRLEIHRAETVVAG